MSPLDWSRVGILLWVRWTKEFRILLRGDSMLIEEIKEALPDIKIMILEPFVLNAIATKEHWDEFRTEVYKHAEKAKAIAEKYDLTFIPLEDKLKEAEKLCPADYWLRDGVHPTTMGHELIKREWIKAFKTL